jgi:hypothetical protein
MKKRPYIWNGWTPNQKKTKEIISGKKRSHKNGKCWEKWDMGQQMHINIYIGRRRSTEA